MCVSPNLESTAVSPSLITGSRPGPENSFTLVLIETETSGLTGSRRRVSLVWSVRPYSFAISLESSGPVGNIMTPALVFAWVRGIIPDETIICFSSRRGLATNGNFQNSAYSRRTRRSLSCLPLKTMPWTIAGSMDASEERIPFSSSTVEKPGSLDVVHPLFQYRCGQPGNFPRIIFPIPSHHHNQVKLVVEGANVSLPDGVADSLPLRIMDQVYWNIDTLAGFFDPLQRPGRRAVSDYANLVNDARFESL